MLSPASLLVREEKLGKVERRLRPSIWLGTPCPAKSVKVGAMSMLRAMAGEEEPAGMPGPRTNMGIRMSVSYGCRLSKAKPNCKQGWADAV